MTNIENINFLDLVQEFNEIDKKEREKNIDIKYGYNDLTIEEDKQLALLNFIFKKVNILEKKYLYDTKIKNIDHIKSEYLRQNHICDGGTCTHGIYSKIGTIVNCDTGCTYLG